MAAEIECGLERVDDCDVAVAAHAIAHHASLATSNLSHFERIPGLALEEWST